MRERCVSDIMTEAVITVSSDTSVPDARQLMADHKIRRLPVVDAGKLTGIVSLSDVEQATPSDATTLSVWELPYLLSRLTVKQIMTPKPVTVTPEASIGTAAQHMVTRKIGGIPVVDGAGKLVGIVTESDIFRLVVREWNK